MLQIKSLLASFRSWFGFEAMLNFRARVGNLAAQMPYDALPRAPPRGRHQYTIVLDDAASCMVNFTDQCFVLRIFNRKVDTFKWRTDWASEVRGWLSLVHPKDFVTNGFMKL